MAATHLPALVYHPCYSELDLPERHRYPITKYRELYQQLLNLNVPASAFTTPNAITADQLQLSHSADYIAALQHGTICPKAMRRIGFPWSATLFSRSLHSLGGGLATAQLAMQHGIAIHLTGGYHHAFANAGSGFCLFNDLVFAAQSMLLQGVDKILIFDLDVHQGDGTAHMLQNEQRIISSSIHCEKNFPSRKQLSDWDVGVSKDCSDSEYLATVAESLDTLIRLHQPELVIYDAGVDCHQDDELGLLNLSSQTIFQRDLLVLSRCYQQNIPVAAVIGGGYQRNITALVQLHLQLFKAAFTVTGSLLASKIKT
ncbi:histone deacetylase family protein [Rheinheimera salexigens]|uniref:Histone deacetylase n=1 Tax=Rheinheimera salexigens TaxID=1628148 RepID=A0A1E7Q8Y1_9GAMM|nr:histone deacetylase [Rheinheimera salexigens]OEY70551.1 histone deacetylase [Rheinheimera salexigens]